MYLLIEKYFGFIFSLPGQGWAVGNSIFIVLHRLEGGLSAHILEVKDFSSLYLEKVLFVVTLDLSGYLDMNLRVQQNCLVSMRHLLAGGYLKGGVPQHTATGSL